MGKKLVIGITAPQSVVLIRGQLNYFKNLGYEVYLLAPKNTLTEDFCKNEGASLIDVDMKREISPVKDLKSLMKIIKKLRKIKPDIVNFGTPKVSLLGLIAAFLLGIEKRIYTCRGFRFEHESGRFKKFLINIEKFTSKMATDVICISNSVKELGIKHHIFTEEKAKIIHYGSSNGIDLNLFDVSNINKVQLEKLASKYREDNCFYYGFVGRLIDRKGISELFKAFKIIYNQDNSNRLLIVGKPYFDQFDKSLYEQIINHPGIVNMGLVTFEDVPYYMALMDVFVLPAYWEGFGNVLVQAAAMGLPIIATNATGCKDAVKNDYNGELVQVGSVDELKEDMIKFRNSPKLRQKYSENSIQWSKNFSPEIIWEGMQELYVS